MEESLQGMSDSETLNNSPESTPAPFEFNLSTVSLVGIEALAHTVQDILKCLLIIEEWVVAPPKHCFQLHKQAKLIADVCHELEEEEATSEGRHRKSSMAPSEDQVILQKLWVSVHNVADRCCADTARPLQGRLRKVVNSRQFVGASASSKTAPLHLLLEDLMWYEEVVQVLSYHADTLHMLRAAISLAYLKGESGSDGELSSAAQEQAQALSSLRAKLERSLRDDEEQRDYPHIRDAFQNADAMHLAWLKVSLNRHFRIRALANTFYTGRRQQLDIIKHALRDPGFPSTAQRRFLVQGAPGSGKTELAIKYALEQKTTYWGVFWVDASSPANAKQSYIEIAKIFGEQPTEERGKEYLSNRGYMYPWLLIIDNADDTMSLEELSPPGDKGCVLVTTRNPAHLGYGDASCGSLVLDQMESNDAQELLLRAAGEPRRTPRVMEYAAEICKHLYFLSLALVHAGKAIIQHSLSLKDYIPFFDREASHIRESWQRRRSRSSSSSDFWAKQGIEDNGESMSVFASFEILVLRPLQGAAVDNEIFEDALQILQVFSFMHFQNIRLDTLIQAAVGPLREATAADEQKRQEDIIVRRLGLQTPQSWKAGLREAIRSLLSRLAYPAVLPDALKNPRGLDADDLEEQVNYRLRLALRVLVTRSLVMRATPSDQEEEEDMDDDRLKTNRYHMHPLVHMWVRERPRLSVAEQALYCQLATTVLSSAVRLTGGDSEDELAMRLEMKPHIEHVRKFSELIEGRIQKNHERATSTWSPRAWARTITSAVSGPWQTQQVIGERARFSKVYLEFGDYKGAEQLLLQVRDYLVAGLGPDHHLAHLAKLGLSGALWHQTRHNESASLLREVYESRKRTLGAKHPRTLESTTQLAEHVLSQGRLAASWDLCQDAHTGLVEAYGPIHRKTLLCINLMGKIHYYQFRWAEALKCQRKALQGAEKLAESGNSSEIMPETEVLRLKEDVAMALMHLGAAIEDITQQQVFLEEAEALIQHVVQRRTELLGRNQPYTLLGKANHGRIMAARGRPTDADALMKETLDAAIRVLGADHHAVLAGKKWYADVLMQMGDLDRAEAYLRDATDKEKYAVASGADGEHPDRILHVWALVRCLEKKEETGEALELCRELRENIPQIGEHGHGRKHTFNAELAIKITELEKIESRKKGIGYEKVPD